MPAPTITVTENATTDPNVRGSLTLSDGFTIESNDEDPAELRESLGLPQKKDKSDKDSTKIAQGETQATADEPAPESRADSRHRNPNKRVDFAVAKQRDAERERDAEKARAEALAKELEELKAKPPEPAPMRAVAPSAGNGVSATAPMQAAPVASAQIPTVPDYERIMKLPGAPDINTFQDLNSFQFAVNTFVTQHLMREAREADQRTAQMQTLRARTDAEITKRPEFRQKLQNLVIDTRVLPYLGSHPMGGDVIVYLADHPEENQVLSSLHPSLEPQMNAAQAGKLGEIVGLLKAQAAAAPLASARPAISQASPVTKRVTGEPPAATDGPPDDDASEEQYEAFWGPRRRQYRSRRA